MFEHWKNWKTSSNTRPSLEKLEKDARHDGDHVAHQRVIIIGNQNP